MVSRLIFCLPLSTSFIRGWTGPVFPSFPPDPEPETVLLGTSWHTLEMATCRQTDPWPQSTLCPSSLCYCSNNGDTPGLHRGLLARRCAHNCICCPLPASQLPDRACEQGLLLLPFHRRGNRGTKRPGARLRVPIWQAAGLRPLPGSDFRSTVRPLRCGARLCAWPGSPLTAASAVSWGSTASCAHCLDCPLAGSKTSFSSRAAKCAFRGCFASHKKWFSPINY